VTVVAYTLLILARLCPNLFSIIQIKNK
jgi:hypothetical protein